MSDLEDSVDAYLDLRDQLEEAEAERDRLKAALKRQLKTSVGFGFEARRLREALEKIHSFAQSCDATPEALLLHIENAARNALAGGSERETHCKLCGERLPPEYRAICPLCAAM